MDEVWIRELTHDDTLFEQQWSDSFTRIHHFFENAEENREQLDKEKIQVLNALIDYVLAEPNPRQSPIYVKLLFVEKVVERCAQEGAPPLRETMEIIHRILDLDSITNRWYLNVIEVFYFKLTLCQNLACTESYDLIEKLLRSLMKHSLVDNEMDENTGEGWWRLCSQRFFSQISSDSNKLNFEHVMKAKRTVFQQIFRHAVRWHKQSRSWNSFISTLIRTLPGIFDTYDDPNEARIDFGLCIQEPILSDYVFLLSKSYNKNSELIKSNLSEAVFVLERLILLYQIREARYFLTEALLQHFDTGIDMEAVVRMVTRINPLIAMDKRDLVCKEILSNLTYKLGRGKCSKKLAVPLFDLALSIIGLVCIEAPNCAEYLLDKNEFYPWKDLAPRMEQLLTLCIAYEKLEVKNRCSQLDSLKNILQMVANRGKAFNAIFRATHNLAVETCLRWARDNNHGTDWSDHLYRLGSGVISLIDTRQLTDKNCIDFIEATIAKINADEQSDDDGTNDCLQTSFFTILIGKVLDSIDMMKGLSYDGHKTTAELIFKALNRPLWQENGQASFEQGLAERVWSRILQYLNNEEFIRLYETCALKIHSIACDENENRMFGWWASFWSYVAFKAPDIATSYVETFFDDVFERDQLNNASWLPALYAKRPEPYHARLDRIISELDRDDIGYNCSLAHIFCNIARDHSELIQSEHVDHVLSVLKTRTSTAVDLHFLFQGLGYVANAQPAMLDRHQSDLVNLVLAHQSTPSMNCLQQYLVASVLVRGLTAANEYLTLVLDLLKNNSNINAEVRSQLFRTCQLIGIIEKQALEAKRADLVELSSYSDCRILIDLIDGNKLTEENQTTINRTREEIQMMQRRVIRTEQVVNDVKDTIQQQESKLNQLDVRVTEVDTRIVDLKEQVDAQALEIERIDAKTLSHVPVGWGRDVSKLLNKRADNDWRLLGKRFGYSTSELRHWSMQNDPTMALLNEWFMTHKTDEATYGLVKMLEEIDRKDAVEIIRAAVEAAGDIIPDEMEIELKRLPPVFLSYQWGIQKAVVNLKTHLEEAGYLCWMDTGQMGGGDKLFTKIDSGIRGAKVVVCCMNSAYAQSDNCSREVHLAMSTGKQLIPLQMEKQKWPPEGALGPIMSEYLFIRFFDRKNNDPNFWPADKFAELLGQIRYHVAPDPDMITDRYRNWFVPRPDNLIFLQPSGNVNPAPVAVDTPLVVLHPQVMISYQWDRQKDIIELYNRLTQLGYRCWLDIFQMGGGDSLFEKIDTGIRNAKCVLACVTPKYIISINCRREMALSDALKKPIVPLYLEETSTWPPPGPMSMVFTDKSFVDFRQINTDLWQSKNFSEVLTRLKDAVPEVNIEQPRRHLIDMKRATTAKLKDRNDVKPQERPRSAPSVPLSRACLLM